MGEQVGQQTSSKNSDIQRIEETALEGSTGCFRNKENQFMLGSWIVLYISEEVTPALNIKGEVGITLGIKVESNSRQKEQRKQRHRGAYGREGAWDWGVKPQWRNGRNAGWRSQVMKTLSTSLNDHALMMQKVSSVGLSYLGGIKLRMISFQCVPTMYASLMQVL